jgi:glycerol-3-phosphate dehydrogenase
MVLEKISPKQSPVAVDLVQGTHIIAEGKLDGMYYVEAPSDGRGVFLLPWYGKTMIGTTETQFDKNPDECVPLAGEIDYLLKTAGRYFPRFAGISPEGISGSFAGLRVLPPGGGNPFNRSRGTLLHEGERLLSIFGGKLTSYRATSESVMKKISRCLPGAKRKADTKNLRLKKIS